MKNIPDLTYKILAIPTFSEMKEIDDVVDWAIEMIENWYENPTLLIIAGLESPVNYFEIKDYLKKSF